MCKSSLSKKLQTGKSSRDKIIRWNFDPHPNAIRCEPLIVPQRQWGRTPAAAVFSLCADCDLSCCGRRFSVCVCVFSLWRSPFQRTGQLSTANYCSSPLMASGGTTTGTWTRQTWTPWQRMGSKLHTWPLRSSPSPVRHTSPSWQVKYITYELMDTSNPHRRIMLV